ncbi:MAG TPA: hypothetical protein VL336_09660 [Sphingomicrobium sp.]|nr:hypothetical protein [Sphingomicrobium sp.]
MKAYLAAAFLAASSFPAPAQQPVMPDLNVPASDLGDERKFFVFHKAGVSLEQARADLGFCSRYIARGQQRFLPDFVAWKHADPARPVPNNLNYGLVGVAIMAIIDGPIDRSIRQARMMRCMLPRGYARYRTSEALWKRINSDDLASAIELQAQIASGPVPPAPRTLP